MFWLPLILTLLFVWNDGSNAEEVICPEACHCTLNSEVDCSNLELTIIPIDIDSKVQILHLPGNRLKSVQFPSALDYLQEVYLSNSSIETIAFDNLPELRIIDLSSNILTNFSALNLNKLEYLNLSFNRDLELKSCHKGNISDSLQILDISFCHVKSLKFVEKLPNLRKLTSKGSAVKDLSTGKSVTLVHLDLAHSRLSHLRSEDILRYTPNLLYLDVSNNQDIRLDLSLKNKSDEKCLQLEHFAASKTRIADIKISSLCKLQAADFSGNGLNIDKNTFKHNIDLKSLNLSFNEINSIDPRTFEANKKLLELDLTRNLLENTAWTQPLANLKSLNLSSNRLTTLDDILSINLLYLDVSGNKISNMSRNISKRFTKLEHLDLSNNLIDNIRQLGIKTLKTLILKYCQILMIEKNSFANMNKLQYLDLTGNKLMRLDFTELSIIPNLQTIRLSNNSWLCDCDSNWMQDLFVYISVNHSFTNPTDLICNEPEARSWKEACEDVWTALPVTATSSLKTAMILLAMIFLVLFCLAGLIYAKHRVKPGVSVEDTTVDQPLNPAPNPPNHNSSLRRAQSEVSVRQTSVDDFIDNPPSYEEAIRMHPVTDTARMTRSMDALVESRLALPTIPE